LQPAPDKDRFLNIEVVSKLLKFVTFPASYIVFAISNKLHSIMLSHIPLPQNMKSDLWVGLVDPCHEANFSLANSHRIYNKNL